jgi:copper transport protein
LPQGVYTIAWKVLSAIDGHIAKGVYSFGVGASPSPGDLIETNAETLLRVLSRWMHYLALMVWGGALVFSQLAYEAFSVKALWELWGLATLTTISELVLYIHSVGELSALVGTVAGIIFIFKLGGLTGAGVTALIKRRWGWLETLLSLGTVSLGAASSHSAALKDSLAIALDVAHLLAGTIWAGGLLAVGVLLRPPTRGCPLGRSLAAFFTLGIAQRRYHSWERNLSSVAAYLYSLGVVGDGVGALACAQDRALDGDLATGRAQSSSSPTP